MSTNAVVLIYGARVGRGMLMIVVDGCTDEEKLLELLAAGAEETALDFKSTLDLSGRASKDSVEFAKDAISLGNLPAGGYIVVGVNDRGTPAHGQAAIAVGQFDSADLRGKVAKYVDAPINVISQHHVVDGRDVVLIFVAPNPDGLPVPVNSIGQYMKHDGRSVTVFSEGEVLIREGTSNVRLRYAHWNQLLGRCRERIKVGPVGTPTSSSAALSKGSAEATQAATVPLSLSTLGWMRTLSSKRS